MHKLLAGSALALLLAGCTATPYERAADIKELHGGYFDQAGPGKLHLVAFTANASTPLPLTVMYAMYHAAEVCQSMGKPYFIMYDSLIDAASDRSIVMPRAARVVGLASSTLFVLPLDLPRRGSYSTAETLAQLREPIAQQEANAGKVIHR